MGVPPNGWLIRENPQLKWLITTGTSHFFGHPRQVEKMLLEEARLIGPDDAVHRIPGRSPGSLGCEASDVEEVNYRNQLAALQGFQVRVSLMACHGF